jgi:alkylhydroperoxidase family enzyme
MAPPPRAGAAGSRSSFARPTISEDLWGELRDRLTDVELIELCMLVGHYEMLAMTLNALAVEPDPVPSGPPSRIVRLLEGAR